MVMIGADSHKRTHTVVGVDDVGRRLGEKTVRTNGEGHLELVRWAARFERRPRWRRRAVRVGGLPAPDPPAGGGPAGRRAAGWSGCRPG